MNFENSSSDAKPSGRVRQRSSMTTKQGAPDQNESKMSGTSVHSSSVSVADAGDIAVKAPSSDIYLGSDSFEPVSITKSQSSRENESTELTSEIEIVYNNDLGTLV
jgi:hypothetical protein